MMFLMPTPNPTNEQHQEQPVPRPEPAVQHQPTSAPAERRTNQLAQDAHAEPIIGVRLRGPGPLRLRQPGIFQSLVERGKPRILGKLRVLPRLVFRHVVFHVRPRLRERAVRQGRGTCRRTEPPGRGPFRKRRKPSQPRCSGAESERIAIRRVSNANSAAIGRQRHRRVVALAPDAVGQAVILARLDRVLKISQAVEAAASSIFTPRFGASSV